MAGQEGFEPPALGFGVRCSTVRATGLRVGNFHCGCRVRDIRVRLFGFAMLGVLSTKRTELAQLKLGSRILFVLLASVVPTLALATRKKDVDAH